MSFSLPDCQKGLRDFLSLSSQTADLFPITAVSKGLSPGEIERIGGEDQEMTKCLAVGLTQAAKFITGNTKIS